MLDFNNTEIAFASKSNNDLRNAYILFKAMSSSVVVKAGKGVTEFATGIGFPLSWAVKPTLYRQFVGGETLQEASKTVGRLKGRSYLMLRELTTKFYALSIMVGGMKLSHLLFLNLLD